MRAAAREGRDVHALGRGERAQALALEVVGDDDGAGLVVEACHGLGEVGDLGRALPRVLARCDGFQRVEAWRLRLSDGGEGRRVKPGAPGFLAAHVAQGPAGAGRDERGERARGIVAVGVCLKHAAQRLLHRVV